MTHSSQPHEAKTDEVETIRHAEEIFKVSNRYLRLGQATKPPQYRRQPPCTNNIRLSLSELTMGDVQLRDQRIPYELLEETTTKLSHQNLRDLDTYTFISTSDIQGSTIGGVYLSVWWKT